MDKAVAYLESSLPKYPRNRVAYTTLGSIYEQSGQTEKAMRIYELALENIDSFREAAQRLAFLLCENGDGEKDLDRSLQLALAGLPTGHRVCRRYRHPWLDLLP